MFQCKEDCGKCCTTVPIPADIFYAATHLMQRPVTKIVPFDLNTNQQAKTQVFPMTEDGTCTFLEATKKCAIYSIRPTVCKITGTDRRFPCPFIDENGVERSEGDAKKLEEEMTERFNTRMLQIRNGS